MIQKVISLFKKNPTEIIVIFFSLLFSFWLMYSTFSYEGGTMYIASKAWSDFASHIPLIRSFSLGANFPVEYPLFSGEPIRYHFMFYLLVGFLEKLGLRLDLALNLPSILSFALLLILMYIFAKTLFQSKFVGILSLILFIFNGSFSFIYFFRKYPLSFPKTILDIWTNTTFPAFAPYDNSLISGGFWNLNVFTNQRHFALPLAISLFIILGFIIAEKNNKSLSIKLSILFGLFIGVLSFLHGAVFVMIIAILGVFFLIFPKQRKAIFIIGLIAGISSIPRTFFLFKVESNQIFKFYPGYLVANSLSFFTWVRYWILNLGLGFFLIPAGFILSEKLPKKIFFAFFTLFVIGNLFEFSPDIATNHKFFNLWLIVSNMFAAYVIYLLWQRKLLQKILVFLFVFFLTLSGIIDFFPIKNDRFISILDYPKNQDIKWIIDHTPKNSTFLNSTYIYNPASLAGRKIFLGWPYFSWSLGYDTDKRDVIAREMFNASEINSECILLKKNKINYISVSEQNDFIPKTQFFLLNFRSIYTNELSGFKIFDVNQTCNSF